MSNEVFDVIVVGGGPSGLTTAAEVAIAGGSVVVLEARTGEPWSRAGTVLPRPLELFDARGVADRLVKRTCEVNPHPFTTSHIWAGMHPVDWSPMDTRFGFTLMLAQSETESVLREWVAELGIELRLGYQVVAVTDSADSITVDVETSEGERRTLTARYLVGADGAHSVTRKAMGIDFEGWDPTFTGLALVCDMPYPFEGGLISEANEHGWLLAFPWSPTTTRMGIVHAEGMKIDRDEPVTLDEVNRYVTEILGKKVEIPALVESQRYGNARRMAKEFRKGRAFLVGESARIHYPASGVGMNFCVQDAFNLGWKLGAVVTGKADDAFLDSYQSERGPVCVRLLDTVDAQVAIQFDFSRQGRKFLERFQENLITKPEVTEQLWAELLGLEHPYDVVDDHHPLAGRAVPDFEVMFTDGSSKRLYELLRSGQPVLVDISNPGVVDPAALSGSHVQLAAGHAIRKPARLHGATVFLVRPDAYVSHVFDGAPSKEDLQSAIDRMYGRV